MPAERTVWTVGHSTRTIDEFIEMLRSFSIGQVVDVRHFPGSRKFPQYNKEALRDSLLEAKISYEHIIQLGGRRTSHPDSRNTAWRHPAFRGYADHMETSSFIDGISRLEKIAQHKRTAYMCSEAVWWRCHRSLISDFLKAKGWIVQHIMDVGKASEHPYTSAAQIIDGQLSYIPLDELPFGRDNS